MGTKERRENERQKIKKEIYKAASEIIINEGYAKLSIRKIASKIDYSPAFIYNYFENKADIVSSIWKENANEIIDTMSKLKLTSDNEKENIKHLYKTYISLILESPEEYRAIMLNDIEGISRIYFDFTEEEKENLRIKDIKKYYDKYLEIGILRTVDTEKYAFFSWISINGLISNIILSSNKDKEFIDKIIDDYLDFMIYGIFKDDK
ncbi:TetR/AcrR family transcriptional regulator [Romboutsia sedimentorum]|uniref:TetR/AcrR family transcriptional regulator n=1 Tax=Romboutsia sedimentorum TaxID=1368474 RepID=A0ABT7E5Z5_9FIRM|nr:TetR/AcrR family transcriptional regulator [Romboutsia sedimentorum]MDK2562355.1 TetR/AcrR family transcriptional regulator [Romboutsia sedimentorum]MDK2584603.1 TetR/AcrR family transcriptional regulator [Romboutsia sedimentorum]